MRLFVFPIYPIVVSGRLHLDIGEIVVGDFFLDGDDRLDQPVWAPDGGNVMVAAIRLRGGTVTEGPRNIDPPLM
jgi:hypothetical protein